MKNILLVTLFALLILGYGVGYFYFDNIQKDLLSDNAKLLGVVDSQNNLIIERNEEILKMNSSLEKEIGINTSLNKEIDSLKLKITEFESGVMCENQISWDVDYSSAGTVHQSLIRWIEEVESVAKSDYKTLWSNSKTSWHEVRGSEYLYYYVVFYDEPDMEYRKGIYSIGCQAYVD